MALLSQAIEQDLNKLILLCFAPNSVMLLLVPCMGHEVKRKQKQYIPSCPVEEGYA